MAIDCFIQCPSPVRAPRPDHRRCRALLLSRLPDDPGDAICKALLPPRSRLLICGLRYIDDAGNLAARADNAPDAGELGAWSR